MKLFMKCTIYLQSRLYSRCKSPCVKEKTTTKTITIISNDQTVQQLSLVLVTVFSAYHSDGIYKQVTIKTKQK